jgi:2-phospho-L-lactate/phosphoenolpyruvate guanylyltransferase
MSIIAILPVKSFDDSKQRLVPALSGGPRRALAEAMFADVLVALRRAKSIDEILVVSSSNSAQQIAAGHGASVVEDRALGHSEAAAVGVSYALQSGANRVLLIPGDCPLLDPAQLDELTARPVAPRSSLVVPDRHGTGTNALLLTPPDSLTPSFGPGSCERHLQLAREQGTAAEVVAVESLALDIDTPEDLAALRQRLGATRGLAAHTRGMLTQMTRSQN